jgi:septal ring-binding cell division protein DamX
LIHTKREQFAERIKGRAQHYEPINPVLAKRWLLSLVGIVFISVFGGMLWWQYPQAPSSLLTQISMIFSKPGKASTETPSMAEQLPPQGIRQAFPVPAVSQADRVANDPSDALTKQAITPGSIEEKAVDPNALVTDWQSAVRQIDKAARNQGKTDVALPLATPLIQSRAAQNTGKKRIVGSKLQSQDANIPLNGQAVRPADELRPPARDGVVDDYQVQDITSVAQLTVQTTAVKAFVPLSEIAAVPRPNTGKQGRKMPIYEYNEETLLSLPEDKYLLQIAAMSKVQTMREYIQDNQLQAKLWIYKTQRQGNDWFVLLHNTDYLSPLAASQASASLPLAMRQGVPFAKTSRQVQTEINQTKN